MLQKRSLQRQEAVCITSYLPEFIISGHSEDRSIAPSPCFCSSAKSWLNVVARNRIRRPSLRLGPEIPCRGCELQELLRSFRRGEQSLFARVASSEWRITQRTQDYSPPGRYQIFVSSTKMQPFFRIQKIPPIFDEDTSFANVSTLV